MASKWIRQRQQKCPQCDFMSREKTRVVEHVENVHNTLVHTCPMCPFKTVWGLPKLKLHIDGHLKIREHACDLCDRKFREARNLRYHRTIIHNIHMAFICTACDRKFGTAYALRRHVSMVHEQHLKKRHACDECDYSTNYRTQLYKHIERLHRCAL